MNRRDFLKLGTTFLGILALPKLPRGDAPSPITIDENDGESLFEQFDQFSQAQVFEPEAIPNAGSESNWVVADEQWHIYDPNKTGEPTLFSLTNT